MIDSENSVLTPEQIINEIGASVVAPSSDKVDWFAVANNIKSVGGGVEVPTGLKGRIWSPEPALMLSVPKSVGADRFSWALLEQIPQDSEGKVVMFSLGKGYGPSAERSPGANFMLNYSDDGAFRRNMPDIYSAHALLAIRVGVGDEPSRGFLVYLNKEIGRLGVEHPDLAIGDNDQYRTVRSGKSQMVEIGTLNPNGNVALRELIQVGSPVEEKQEDRVTLALVDVPQPEAIWKDLPRELRSEYGRTFALLKLRDSIS